MVKMIKRAIGNDGFLGMLHALLLMDDTVHTPPEAFFGFKKKNEETAHTPCTVKVYRLQK